MAKPSVRQLGQRKPPDAEPKQILPARLETFPAVAAKSALCLLLGERPDQWQEDRFTLIGGEESGTQSARGLT
jgi:hypothetical protein